MNYFSSPVLNASLLTCLVVVLFLGAGCGESPDRSAAAPVDAESVDLLFHNGQILIVDDAFSIHSVLAVSNGKVVASGGEEVAVFAKRTRFGGVFTTVGEGCL